MASIFTYDPNPPRVSSPWSTPGRATPQLAGNDSTSGRPLQQTVSDVSSAPMHLSETGITRLEAEPQEGPTEYKLHLLLRPRRTFSSTSTSNHDSWSQLSMAYLPKAGLRRTSLTLSHSVQPPSTPLRQTRLQQLTTQLLWRLQQSSPFHSCSTGSLVLPNLPEATPKLGIPREPATLLPGLEESQGALYEIGISDDGTFVGLAEDELDESLTNLKAMAASLGCVVDVLRRVIVGRCEWRDLSHSVGATSAEVHVDNLWVAEALVRPDLDKSISSPPTAFSLSSSSMVIPHALNGLDLAQPEVCRSKVEQLRVSITGATNSGKSSLLGTLTTSRLDNGRGKSRLNLLKHRHEIASGVTSSVAQELIGYRKQRPAGIPYHSDQILPEVVNYASENVSSWNDIHSSAARLIFLSDSPGLQRYSKSTVRTLVSWKPHWTILCVASNCCDEKPVPSSITPALSSSAKSIQADPNSSLDPLFVHLGLCLKLDLPIIIAVTKMDIATKLNLRQTLSKLLSALKTAGKKPVLMSTSDWQGRSLSDLGSDLQYISLADETEVEKVMKKVADVGTAGVPIVLTSAMTGQGLGMLHGLLKSMPILPGNREKPTASLTNVRLQKRNDVPPKIFQVDEVFAMPPSKVYSASVSVTKADHGTVLCGHLTSASIFIGDILTLGPFLAEKNEESKSQNHSLHHSSSFPNSDTRKKPSSHGYSKSIPASQTPPLTKAGLSATAAMWQAVRVVSVRNLRLPTRSLLAGQVGTIGVELLGNEGSSSCDLRRARKGMILASFEEIEPSAYQAFTASFPASDFKASDSPPLILGGHATAYINSIRAPVKVICVALSDHDSDSELPGIGDSEVFAFDGDGQNSDEGHDINVKFRFLSTVEWMRLDDRVLVVPNAAAVGPVTGGSVAATGGLNGFVGRICDLST